MTPEAMMVILTTMSGAIATLFGALMLAWKGRTDRAEKQVDSMLPTLERLAASSERQTAAHERLTTAVERVLYRLPESASPFRQEAP